MLSSFSASNSVKGSSDFFVPAPAAAAYWAWEMYLISLGNASPLSNDTVAAFESVHAESDVFFLNSAAGTPPV